MFLCCQLFADSHVPSTTRAGFLPAGVQDMFMSQRHPIQNGRCMLITTNAAHRMPIFLEDACARIAIETLYGIQQFYPFFLYAFVVMPDHCHLLLKMPEGGSVPKMVGIYKRAVSFNIGRGPLWQPRFHMRMVNNGSAADGTSIVILFLPAFATCPRHIPGHLPPGGGTYCRSIFLEFFQDRGQKGRAGGGIFFVPPAVLFSHAPVP